MCIMCKDMSNPLTRLYMVFYPEDAGCEASQTWHGEKWLKMAPDDVLTPMVKHLVTGRHYYVGELSKYGDGTLFIPMCWFHKKGQVCGPKDTRYSNYQWVLFCILFGFNFMKCTITSDKPDCLQWKNGTLFHRLSWEFWGYLYIGGQMQICR